MINIVEYNPSIKGLERVNQKLLDNGAIVDNNSLSFDESTYNAVVNSYIEDGETSEMAKYIVDYFIWIYKIEGNDFERLGISKDSKEQNTSNNR